MNKVKILPILLILFLAALPLGYSEPIDYGIILQPSKPFLSFIVSPILAPNGANCDSTLDTSKRLTTSDDVMALGVICAPTSRVLAYYCNDYSCSNKNLIADKFKLDGVLPSFNVGTGNDVLYECYNCEGSTQASCSKTGNSLYINNNFVEIDKCSNPTLSIVPTAYKTIYLCNGVSVPSNYVLVNSFDGYMEYLGQDTSCGTQSCPITYCPNGAERPYDSHCNPLPCPPPTCVRDGNTYRIGDIAYKICSGDKKSTLTGIVVNVEGNQCQYDIKTANCQNTCSNGICVESPPTGCTKEGEATETGKPCCDGLIEYDKGLFSFERCVKKEDTLNCAKEGEFANFRSCCEGLTPISEKLGALQCVSKCSLPSGSTCDLVNIAGGDDTQPSNQCKSGICVDVGGVGGRCHSEDTYSLKSGIEIKQHSDCVVEEENGSSEGKGKFTKFVESLGKSINSAFGGKSKTGLDNSTLGWLVISAIGIIILIAFTGGKK